jgi:quercetin dioxygenase-like cupin family protein
VIRYGKPPAHRAHWHRAGTPASAKGKIMSAQEHTPAYVREHGPLQTPLRVVRFANEITSLKQDPAWQSGERAARTLVKEGRLRAVLTLMRAGMRLHDHKTDGAVTVHCLQGRMQLQTAIGHPLELIEGELVALDAGVTHSVEALTECAFLVTLAQ